MSLSDSRFNMWRAVTAMIHADGVVRPHEINFILENTRTLPLTTEQLEILTEDLRTAGCVEDFFRQITSPKDKNDFFHLARAISWSDGELDEREEALLARIRSLAADAEDVTLMERALGDFRDVYIEGSRKDNTPMSTMIRGLLGQSAA